MNVFESRSPIYIREFLNRILTALSTNPAAALIATPEMHLIASPGASFSPLSVVADFEAVECDYDDYAPLALTGGVIANVDAFQQALTWVAPFAVTSASPAVANTVWGYWIEGTAGIVMYEVFPEAERTPLAAQGDMLVITAKLPAAAYFSLPVQE